MWLYSRHPKGCFGKFFFTSQIKWLKQIHFFGIKLLICSSYKYCSQLIFFLISVSARHNEDKKRHRICCQSLPIMILQLSNIWWAVRLLEDKCPMELFVLFFFFYTVTLWSNNVPFIPKMLNWLFSWRSNLSRSYFCYFVMTTYLNHITSRCVAYSTIRSSL